MAVVSPTAKAQFIDAAGIPLAGGFLYTYVAGTTTPQATYIDSAASTANSNPIILDSRGEANIWLTGASYKFILCDANNTEIWTVDNIAPPSTAVSPVFTTNVTISDNSPGPALLITQLGAGPAIRVQDETDPDASPFIVDSTGSVGIGIASPGNKLDVAGGAIQISTAGGTARTVMSADATDSIFSVNDDRNFTVKTNASTRLTVNSTAATTTVPVVLPANPTTALQAATKQYVDTTGTTTTPPGSLIAFAGTTAPSGWLACQGQVISQTTYAALYAAIGATWNTGGEGAGNFRLPDLRGTFLRGSGTNATGSSSGAVGQAVGVYAVDTYLNHSHGITDPGHTHTYSKPQATSGASGSAVSGNEVGSTTGSRTTGITVNTSTTGDTETKPKNYAVLYIIKT